MQHARLSSRQASELERLRIGQDVLRDLADALVLVHRKLAQQAVPVGYMYVPDVRQQVIATLGRLDELQASGQLEWLVRSGAREM